MEVLAGQSTGSEFKPNPSVTQNHLIDIVAASGEPTSCTSIETFLPWVNFTEMTSSEVLAPCAVDIPVYIVSLECLSLTSAGLGRGRSRSCSISQGPASFRQIFQSSRGQTVQWRGCPTGIYVSFNRSATQT